MRAMLIVDDQSDTIDMKVLFEGVGGFDVTSPAHRHMKTVLMICDRIAEMRETEGEHVVDLGNLPKSIMRAIDQLSAKPSAPIENSLIETVSAAALN